MNQTFTEHGRINFDAAPTGGSPMLAVDAWAGVRETRTTSSLYCHAHEEPVLKISMSPGTDPAHAEREPACPVCPSFE